MKNFNGRRLSIKKDTNRIMFDSETDLLSVREGAVIKIGLDQLFYTVAAKEKKFIIKTFNVLDDFNIEVDNNELNFFTGDHVKLSFKEYSLIDTEVISGGEDCVLHFGDSEITVKNNKSQITKRGKHLVKEPFLESGAIKIKLFYEEIDVRHIVSNVIESNRVENNKNILSLDQPLQIKAKEGKISTEKWEATLSENYIGKDKNAIEFTLMNFFTPHLGLMLIPGDSPENLAINESFKKLEQKIMELEKRINSI